MRFQYRLLK